MSVEGTETGKRSRDEDGDGVQVEDSELAKKSRSEQVSAPSETGTMLRRRKQPKMT